ncbi:BTB/POZ and MATH domain-containing protein 3-like [Aegilops tauschii subsp. strangulata]|uniref:TD and POZ domain-containing protein 4 n=1 Tax=Aegilops tauschii TaxID=37682 RepID=M8BCT7_AEGTA|nr:BTB/POZ and MATH domain-containing protein 3-like [Aegilops tauschii subsp. strangulata]
MANRSSTSPEITPSRSRCIVEHDTEKLSFELINYMQLKGMEVGKFVSSPVCRVGGYEWEIRFYPDGLNKEYTGNTSCFLCYLGKDQDVRAKFSLSMQETKGLQAQVASFGTLDYAFTTGLNEFGYPQFVTTSKLKSLARFGDGCFTIRCVLSVSKESPPLELHDDLERMLEEGLGADVTFGVGGREFDAHRYIMAARSPVFRAQFFGPMAEKDMRHVEVIDVEPTIFEMMLRYIYNDKLPSCNNEGGGYNAAI